tara:strand:- start:676 stop:1119 length:444 start_codon:yes stop_codon:yes gene_type:complete
METKTMTLQEMFDKAVAHFADMDRPSMTAPNEYGGTDCAYRGHEGNKCIVGAFIDDEHYDVAIESKGVLEYESFNKSCGVQPVLNAVAASMGVEALDFKQQQLLYKLQLIHDDHSDGFDINEDNWYSLVEAPLIDLAYKSGLEHNVG